MAAEGGSSWHPPAPPPWAALSSRSPNAAIDHTLPAERTSLIVALCNSLSPAEGGGGLRASAAVGDGERRSWSVGGTQRLNRSRSCRNSTEDLLLATSFMPMAIQLGTNWSGHEPVGRSGVSKETAHGDGPASKFSISRSVSAS